VRLAGRWSFFQRHLLLLLAHPAKRQKRDRCRAIALGYVAREDAQVADDARVLQSVHRVDLVEGFGAQVLFEGVHFNTSAQWQLWSVPMFP